MISNFFDNQSYWNADGNKSSNVDKVKKVFKSPLLEGFKKYVVIEDFLSSYSRDIQNGIAAPRSRQFKKGMNLFAKITPYSYTIGAEPEDRLISYGGWFIDASKVKEKNPNVYEKIQSFFKIKKGFA